MCGRFFLDILAGDIAEHYQEKARWCGRRNIGFDVGLNPPISYSSRRRTGLLGAYVINSI